MLEWWRGGSVEYLVAGLIPQSCNFFGFWMALTEMDVLMCPFFWFLGGINRDGRVKVPRAPASVRGH